MDNNLEVTDVVEVSGEENSTPEETTENSDGQQTTEPVELTYTKEQMESAIKARVSTFNKKLEKMRPYETAMNKISEITGLSVDSLIARLEGMSDYEQASILGITPQELVQRRQLNSLTNSTTMQNQILQRELEEQKMLSNPKYQDFTLYREEVYDMIEENPGLTMAQAYTLVKGEIATSAAARDAEQRAVAKMTKSSNQKVVTPGATSKNDGPKLDAFTIAAAKRVGMDPAEYAAYSGIQDLDQYEKFISSKK